MAAAVDLLCTLYEEKVVSGLCPPHTRADGKLTQTERARLVSAFVDAWHLMFLTGTDVSARQPVKVYPAANDVIEDSIPEQSQYEANLRATTIEQSLTNSALKHIVRIREVAIFIGSNVRRDNRIQLSLLTEGPSLPPSISQ